MEANVVSCNSLKFTEEDSGFGDVLCLEYCLHAAICNRLSNIPAHYSNSDHTALLKSSIHSLCAKKLHSLAIEEFGDLPADEVIQLRYLVFACVDNLFFFQHNICKITDNFVQCCCEEHKFYYGFDLACQSFESLIRHPAFQFENCFSIFQLLQEFKLHLVIQRASCLEELHRLAREVMEKEVILLENEKQSENGIFDSIFAKDYVKYCSNQCETFLAVREEDFIIAMDRFKKSYPVEEFEIHFRNFLKNYYSRFEFPFLFGLQNGFSTECTEENNEIPTENVIDTVLENHGAIADSRNENNVQISGNGKPDTIDTPSKGKEIPRTPPPVHTPLNQQLQASSERCESREPFGNEQRISFDDSQTIEPKILIELFPGYSSDYTQIVFGTHPAIKSYLKERMPNFNVSKGIFESTATSHQIIHDEESAKKVRRTGNPWTQQEVNYIIEGVKSFGNNWKRILESYPFDSCRTNTDLKDKARTLKRSGLFEAVNK